MFRQIRTRRAVVDLDEVEQPVEVEVREGRAATAVEGHDARLLGALDERPIGLAEQQVARIAPGEVGHRRSTLPLETNRSMKPSLLTSSNCGCHAVEGRIVSPVNGRCRGHPALERDVAVARLRGPVGQGLELVVALARQVDLRVAVAGEVLAGDPHPPDLHVLPAVGSPYSRGGCPGSTRQSCSAPSR